MKELCLAGLGHVAGFAAMCALPLEIVISKWYIRKGNVYAALRHWCRENTDRKELWNFNGAVSSFKCNSLLKRFTIKHSSPNFIGGSPFQSFSRSVIKLFGDLFKFSLSYLTHIHTLGQILAQ
jgi:hypothetical protein